MPGHLYSMLYHSELANSASPSCVPEIIKTARAFNANHGVTGILVFDGHRFLQHLEGQQQILQDLILRIAKDPRHTNFRLQYAGINSSERQYRNWSMAYAPIEDEVLLTNFTRLNGAAALDQFVNLIPTFDMV